MSSVDVYIDELQFEICFESQRHARQFSSTPPQTWYPILLQLINDELNHFFVQQRYQSHIQIDTLALSLPMLNMSTFDNDLQTAIKRSIRETLENLSYDTKALISPKQPPAASSSPIASWLYNLNTQLRATDSRFAASQSGSDNLRSTSLATEDLLSAAVNNNPSLSTLQALTMRFRQLINQQKYTDIAHCLAPYLSHASDVQILFNGLYNLSSQQIEQLHQAVKRALVNNAHSVTLDSRNYAQHGASPYEGGYPLGPHYYRELLQKMVAETPCHVSQQLVHALVCHASDQLNVFLRSGLDQHQLVRFCHRLNDASLQLICDALCASVALLAPEQAMHLCQSQTGMNKALAWRHLIDFIVFEGIDVKDSTACMYVSAELATTPTGGNAHSPLAKAAAALPILSNEPSAFFTIEMSQIIALVKSRPYKVMLWYEAYVALPLMQTLDSAQAFTWPKASKRLLSLIDVFAFLLKQTEPFTSGQHANKSTSTWQHRYKHADKLIAEQSKVANALAQRYQQTLDGPQALGVTNKDSSKQIVAVFAYYYLHHSLCQLVSSRAISAFTPLENIPEDIIHWLNHRMHASVVKETHRHSEARSLSASKTTISRPERLSHKQLHEQFDLWMQSSPRSPNDFFTHIAQPTNDTVAPANISTVLHWLVLPTALAKLLHRFDISDVLHATLHFTGQNMAVDLELKVSNVLQLIMVVCKKQIPTLNLNEVAQIACKTAIKMHGLQGLSYAPKWLTHQFIAALCDELNGFQSHFLLNHERYISELIDISTLSHSDTSALTEAIVTTVNRLNTAKQQHSGPIVHKDQQQHERGDSDKIVTMPNISEDSGTNFSTAYAGLVIFHPFLKQLFSLFTLLNKQKDSFNSDHSQVAAMLALHYIATGDTQLNRPCDPLIAVLCGLDPHAHNLDELSKYLSGEDAVGLSAQQCATIDSMLATVLTHWNLKNTRIDGFRRVFLQRAGLIYQHLIDCELAYTLHVEFGPFDYPLEDLPWAISMCHLPWQSAVIQVEWS